MKKKGFTLIELLAVIIILAVIALIATPVVLNVVENARKSAFQRSANGYYDAARYLYDELYLNNDRQDLMFTFEDGVQTSSNGNYKLQVKGEVPKGGIVYLASDGQIMVSIHNEKYCATTDATGKVNISEDVSTCGYAPVECFTYSDFNLDTEVKDKLNEEGLEFEGMDGDLLQIDSFDSEDPSCKGIVIIPEEHEGRKVEGIKGEVFKDNTSIASVVLPKKLKIIGRYAFSGTTNLNRLIVDDELRYIDVGSFANTSNLNEVTLPSKLFLESMAFMKSGIRKLVFLGNIMWSNGENYTAKASPFRGSNLEEVIIGNKVTNISGSLFYNHGIKNVAIPNSVISIGDMAFANNQLTSIIIPDSVIYIGNRAFEKNQFLNANAITIEGDATRFDSIWTDIGFPAK